MVDPDCPQMTVYMANLRLDLDIRMYTIHAPRNLETRYKIFVHGGILLADFIHMLLVFCPFCPSRSFLLQGVLVLVVFELILRNLFFLERSTKWKGSTPGNCSALEPGVLLVLQPAFMGIIHIYGPFCWGANNCGGI